MKRKTIKQLETELAESTKHLTEQCMANRKEEAKRREAEARETETREQFADLKKRLHEAEIENARQRGYLSRVHEDDIVADGLVEIEDANGKRQVPKRPPPMMAGSQEHFEQFNTAYDQYGREKKRTHWTNY